MKVMKNYSNITKSLVELKEQHRLLCNALSNRQMYTKLTHKDWESLTHRKLVLVETINSLESLEDNYQVLLDTNKLALNLK